MPPGSLLCVSRPAGTATNVPLHERLIIPLLQTSLTLQPPRPLEGRDQKLTFLDFSLEVSPVMALRGTSAARVGIACLVDAHP